MYCGDNNLIFLPDLPKGLTLLSCGNNKLTKLPTLPDELKVLDCSNNRLIYLPKLPNTITWLDCRGNKYLHISKEIAEKHRLEETPDYGKIGLCLKKIVSAKKRRKKLVFCEQLKDVIDTYIYIPGRVGYEELKNANKGRYVDL